MNRIDTPTHRKGLKPRREPYWRKITTGRYLGFRRSVSGGSWIARYWDKDADKQCYGALVVLSLWDSKEAYEDAFSKALEWFSQAERVEDHHYQLKDAVADYVEHLKVNNSEVASKDAKQRLEKHLSKRLMATELTGLRSAQIKRWHQSLVRLSDDEEDVRRSKDGANKLLSKLKAALNVAFNSGLVATDREWRRVKPFKGVGGARILFLTDKQVKRLLEKTKGELHNLIQAGVLTGARYGELANARVKDLDTKQGTLYLDGKTGGRDCYLSDEALKYFREQCKDKLPGAWILVKDDGTPWGKSHHSRGVRDAVKTAKLPRDTVFYSLRHYYISKALLAGIPAQVVAENCGTSIRMIELHYGKFLPKDRKRMLNQVKLG